MKKWSGGTLIITLAVILFITYSARETHRQKQSSFDFFNGNSKRDHAKMDDVRMHQSPEEFGNLIIKPHLVTIEGIESLYTIPKFSEHVSGVTLLWAEMWEVILRSDSLPETTQGVKEASVAWRHLLAALEKEKVLKRNNTSSNRSSEDLNCPFSLSTFNIPSVRNGSLMEIPCGLVQDSSITVVGIPSEQTGNFYIDLMGSPFRGDIGPDIILHYNVTFKGNNVSEGSTIVQNTWTAQHGWGVAETCPHGSSLNVQVDDLVSCNQQFGGTVIEDLNKTQFDIYSNLSLAKQGTPTSLNFPFVDGQPFAATLWVGREGFHMTVNGRHETSFAYRPKLEPWIVSGVKVTGNLNLLSVMATQLPVSEDPSFDQHVENLKAPPISKKRIFMLIGIFSTGNNFDRRMALRRSWMQYEDIRSGNVAVRFIIGLHKNDLVNIQLLKEAKKYEDIQLMPFVDYYGLITLKTIATCILGTKVLPAKYIMKTDDDAFVRVNEILSILREKKVSSGLLYGLISFNSAPIRDENSKWYISEEEWSHSSYPPWAHGPGYIISRDVAKFIVKGHHERMLKLFKLEDVAVGIWIEQYKRSGQQVSYISDDRFHNAGCESDYILAHYQGPRLMLCLWDKLLRGNEPTCCE